MVKYYARQINEKQEVSQVSSNINEIKTKADEQRHMGDVVEKIKQAEKKSQSKINSVEKDRDNIKADF